MGTSPLPKRFYEHASCELRDGLFVLLLDGKLAHTPRRHPLAVSHESIAVRLVSEWQAQEGVINPSTMPLTRLINVALDAVAGEMESVRAEVVKYAASDALCYRASTPEELVTAQNQAWDGVVKWAQNHFGTPLHLSHSLTHVAQEPTFLNAIETQIAKIEDPLILSALHVMMTLSGSALLALSVYHGHISGNQAWQAAHVDEFYQERHWGMDDEAVQRRAHRWIDFEASAFVANSVLLP
jgi:chaperone required for assembly of F1-ATPase